MLLPIRRSPSVVEDERHHHVDLVLGDVAVADVDPLLLDPGAADVARASWSPGRRPDWMASSKLFCEVELISVTRATAMACSSVGRRDPMVGWCSNPTSGGQAGPWLEPAPASHGADKGARAAPCGQGGFTRGVPSTSASGRPSTARPTLARGVRCLYRASFPPPSFERPRTRPSAPATTGSTATTPVTIVTATRRRTPATSASSPTRAGVHSSARGRVSRNTIGISG